MANRANSKAKGYKKKPRTLNKWRHQTEIQAFRWKPLNSVSHMRMLFLVFPILRFFFFSSFFFLYSFWCYSCFFSTEKKVDTNVSYVAKYLLSTFLSTANPDCEWICHSCSWLSVLNCRVSNMYFRKSSSYLPLLNVEYGYTEMMMCETE